MFIGTQRPRSSATSGATYTAIDDEHDLGGTTFGVGNGTALGIAPGSQFSATFEVDDVAAMRELLAAQGVPVTDVMDSPVCLSCFVTDPDGNRFGLHQRKPR